MPKRLEIKRPQRKNKNAIIAEGVSATGEDYTISILDDGTLLIAKPGIGGASVMITKQADLEALQELLGYLDQNNYKID